MIFNTYKNNEKIIPSAMVQKRRQVCGFLFADWGVSDCFYDGLMPNLVSSIQCSVYRKNCLEVVWHLAIVKTITSIVCGK
ncbi:MAG: hypothetical protein PHC28_12075 [Flavobacterium sp.]|uniref:hypothetical protein n=1 Tax=Flavobacterium sp. TaxID=239 RepID=UPI0026062653|nr:hypothetical protein [Flavobacterium sp.]MDD5151191.1 hypothetical protein [Flavobacterium sp.]